MPPYSRAMADIAERLFGSWVRQVGAATLRADLLAGVLGALLVLPQGIAFASLAGLPPEYGLYTAIVPCIVAALFGSSWHVVTGPTNALSLALLATLSAVAVAGSPQYIQLALAVTVLVGVMQWLIGMFRLGAIANFISPSTLRGFTSGAAALIALHALPDLLGLPAPASPGSAALLAHLQGVWREVVPAAALVGFFTVAAVLVLRRLHKSLPHMLIALVAASLLAYALQRSGMTATWGRLALTGNLGDLWPRLSVPSVEWQAVPELLGIAFALTIVALGQSISIAKALAERTGQPIDANREFTGQGVANIVGGFTSCYVACGSLNRSLPNLQAGARTPLAAVFASLWLLVLLALCAPLLALIPLAGVAGLLMVVAWQLFDVAAWRRLWRQNRQEFAIATATLVATLTVRLELAILLGTLLSLTAFVYRTARPSMRAMGFNAIGAERPFVVVADAPHPLPECPQLKMIRMEGEVYFGAVAHVGEQLRALRASATAPKHLLIMAKSMNFIDLAGADLWRTELAARRQAGGDLYFHRPRPSVLDFWERTGFIDEIGRDHIFPTKRVAIATIFDRLDRGVCATCTVRVFEECARLLPADQRPRAEVAVAVASAERGDS
ncbi:MAG: sulfate transporter [Methylibium sp. NZG]|nr:MAG: sulfate transporter [Methylibium sp. NZG]